MFNAFMKAFVQSSSTMRLVFHGTPTANVNAICANGLDSTRRNTHGQVYGAGEYFAEDPIMAVPYSAAAAGATAAGGGGCGAAIIVFVVLITEDTVHNANGIVVVNQMAHQLPLGVAHFHFDHAAAATALPQGVTSLGRPPHALFRAGQRHIAKDFARLQNKRSSSGGGGGGGSSSSSSSSGGGGGGGGGFTHPCPTCKSIVGCGCRSSSSSSSSSSSRPTKKRRLSLPPAASRK